MPRSSSAIPNPHTARHALSVTDGGETVGCVIAHDGSFFAYDSDGELIGEYASQGEAMNAIPNKLDDQWS